MKHSTESQLETKCREDLKTASHFLYQKGLTSGYDGNLSLKVSDKFILVTPTNCHKGLIEESDFILIDSNGNVISNGNKEPTSDLIIHLEAYKKRPDITALIHAHPPTLISLTVADINFNQPVLPGIITQFGEIPTVSYIGPDRKIECELTVDFLKNHDAVVLDRHGAVTVGKNISYALHKMESIEYLAKVLLNAHLLGEIKILNENNTEKKFKLKDIFKKLTDSNSPIFQRILNLTNELTHAVLERTNYSQKLSDNEKEELSRELTASFFGMILGKFTRK